MRTVALQTERKTQLLDITATPRVRPVPPGRSDGSIPRHARRPVTRRVTSSAELDLVEDVVAETFLVAWRRLDDIPAEARPWLLGVARKTLTT